MKAAAFMLVLLCSSPAVFGRKLLQDGCADLSVLAAYPELSAIGSVIQGFGLLPQGVPAGVTIFLPTNDAVDGLLAGIPFPGLTIDNLVEQASAIPLVLNKLVSALLYHIVPGGAFTPEDLLAEGTLQTALPDYTLQFDGAAGNYTLTTLAGQTVGVQGPVEACGSSIYIVDQVLQPAALLSIPDTTLEEALAILGQSAATPAPAPAP
jgi:hypothetical protein